MSRSERDCSWLIVYLSLNFIFDAMLCSFLDNKNSDEGHFKCSRGPQAPHPCFSAIRTIIDGAGPIVWSWFTPLLEISDNISSHLVASSPPTICQNSWYQTICFCVQFVVCTNRPLARFSGFRGGRNRFLEGHDFCSYLYVKQIFLGTTKFRGALPQNAPPWLRVWYTL